jgi:hypothetical protein
LLAPFHQALCPRSSTTDAFGVNASQVVLGRFTDFAGRHGFSYLPGTPDNPFILFNFAPTGDPTPSLPLRPDTSISKHARRRYLGHDSSDHNKTALPLFATGLSALGLLGWRKKLKAQAVA